MKKKNSKFTIEVSKVLPLKLDYFWSQFWD